MNREDDSSITEIDILPDGRVCLFGASQQVLEILDGIPLGDPALSCRIDCLRAAHVKSAGEPNEACCARSDETMKNRVRR